MALRHPAFLEFLGWADLFKETRTISEFNQKLKKACATREKDDPGTFDPMKMVGDGGEIFVEALFRLTETNKRFGIGGYIPNLGQDNGVDGSGTLYNGKLAMVQVKWYQNPTKALSATGANLNSFYGEAQRLLRNAGQPVEENEFPRRMIVVTSARGLQEYTENEKFKNEVRCIGYKELKDELDNNVHFWYQAYELVRNSTPGA